MVQRKSPETEETPIKPKKLWLWIASFAGALGTIVGLYSNLESIMTFINRVLSKIDGILFDGRITHLALNRPYWLLLRLGIIFTVTSLAIAGTVLLWMPSSRIRKETHDRGHVRAFIKLATPSLAALLISLLSIGLVAEGPYWKSHANVVRDAEVVCPQCAQFGTCAVRTYANNGIAQYSINDQGEPGGPRGHAKITLQAYLPDEEHGSGWVVFLPRGTDLSKFKELRFWIRGERGGEILGVKMKDAEGIEVPIPLIDPYVLGQPGIKNSWKEVSIPLSAFPKVELGLMDNFSLYVNGNRAGTALQIIYVGGIEWR